MPVWVQLRKSMYLTENGRNRPFQPGDWVQIGKQLARAWIADGTAVSPFPADLAVEEPAGTCGIMMFGAAERPDVGVPVEDDGRWELRWEKTCFWDVRAPVNPAMYAIGFHLVGRWEAAIPLWDYTQLAESEPDSGDVDKTRAVIRDLRVPMYDHRLMFMRRCEATRRLLEAWEQEGPGRLAFLRALYRVKPLILALPVTWTGQKSPNRG
jgi:hypothetical protein